MCDRGHGRCSLAPVSNSETRRRGGRDLDCVPSVLGHCSGFCHLTWQRDSAGATRVIDELTLDSGQDPGLPMGHCDPRCPVEQRWRGSTREEEQLAVLLEDGGGGPWEGERKRILPTAPAWADLRPAPRPCDLSLERP